MSGPIYLVRHAKAGHRERWTDDDELRPLTKNGWRQAHGLVELFDGQPFARLLSSRYVRCVQTLEPLAEARGLEIEEADGLAEGSSRAASVELLLGAAESGPVALSTHGDIVEHVLDELAESQVPLTGPTLLEKGSTWVLDVADGAIRAGRYLPPP
ncbi:MAG TPA: phosphoglycerate mutase family protein [Gaiellaceae bacterium]